MQPNATQLSLPTAEAGESGSADTPRPLAIRLLSWAGSILLAGVALTLIFTVNLSLHRTAYNSDLVHPYLLLEDLLADPAAIFRWQLSPAIYTFPDWPLAGLLVALRLSPTALPLVYGGILLTLLGVCIGWMLVTMQTARWPEAVLWGWLLIAGLFLASNSSPIGLGGTYLSFIATAYIHSGAMLAGMLLIPLLTEVFHGEGPVQRRARWAAAVLVPLACYSDLVFVAWFAAPVCTAFLITPTPMPFRGKLRLVIGLGALGLLAAAIDLARPSRIGVDLDRNLAEGFLVWQDLLARSFDGGQWQIWLPIALTVPMAARGGWLLAAQRVKAPTRQRSVELALILATISSLAIPFLAGAMVHESKLRYSLPVMVLPWVWLLLLASRWNTHERRQGLLAAGVALAVGCLPLLPQVPQAVSRIEATQKLKKTLERLDQRAGYGDYWTAKPIMFETSRQVHCIPLLLNGQPDTRNYNMRWFTERADGAGAIEPTFVVTSRLNQDTLRRLFGEPDAIEKFRKDQFVWLYDEPLPLIRLPSAADSTTQTSPDGDTP